MTGLQYYHLGKILLTLCNPEFDAPGVRSFASYRKIERNVISHLRTIIGMTLCAEQSHAQIVACHAIYIAGAWCQNDEERKRVISFLETTEKISFWPTNIMSKRLLREWE